MSSTNESQQQAFRSLIESVTNVDTGSSGPKTNLSPEAIQRLSERLSEIVGFDAIQDFTPKRNERGELVNEEGLPIVDITEPVPGNESEELIFMDRDPIVKLDQVAPSVRERLSQHRERLLDMLEAEERAEEEKEREKERAEIAEIARKRAEAAANEKKRLAAAKEMQKRMGKALIKNLGESRAKDEREKEIQRLKDEESDAKRKAASASVAKKTVTFAPGVASGDDEYREQSWGDVIPGQLKPVSRPTMKMNVVERVPVSKPLRSPLPPTRSERDSDDESDLDDQSLDGGSDQELEEETDLDYASLQRQVELEYLQKRAAIGQAAATAMQELSSQTETPATETEESVGISFKESQKPAVSQFRANKLASAYGASNPTSVVPVATAKTIQKSIRTGKLDEDGNLVGGEDDSASELEDEGMQEVLQLLRKGEVYNLGPNGEYIHTVHPQDAARGTGTSSAPRVDDPSKTLPPLNTKNPVSKFKVSRAAAGRPSDSVQSLSPSPTPVSDLNRSSPKTASPTAQAAPKLSEGLSTTSLNPMSMIVDSSSFAPSPGSSTSRASFSMIVESPSFPPTGGMKGPNGTFTTPVQGSLPPRTSRPDRPPTVIASTVRESKPITKPPAPSSESSTPAKVSKFKRDRTR
ncbi:hypothetical protein CC1G_01228 [Coprinopsis cinerea okayama7|uniref:DUF3835 domain-containing protein n=1 Tax=Coprinopsis cinerea (strain Okayama-7 / 130 / ATCC MYA-4618 / FGSC 9003) TaxID=240176 RepID=A8NEY8_COPC7|nr:hypothetical protein CC1G_01228 [Coprinopsis cinerea okayama7\|eukprot:XP_001833166.2 hypothetical protein CC1G_01228 [Coprinopsis cinerea okayama7\